MPEHVLSRREERSAGMGRILFHSTGVGAERQMSIQQRRGCHRTGARSRWSGRTSGCRWYLDSSLADVAQTAERLTCNQQVAGSTPAVGSRRGVVATCNVSRGSSSVGRASAFQAERRGFDSRLPLCDEKKGSGVVCHDGPRGASHKRLPTYFSWRHGAFAQVAQSAEHVLGKDEVGGSIPLLGLLKKAAVGRVQIRCARGEAGRATGMTNPHGHREMPCRSPVCGCSTAVSERYPSGQREQTVNLPAYAFGGSNPPLSMHAESLRS